MTMLLVLVTPQAVFMGADSRQFPSGLDGIQKIFLVNGDSIVGKSGIGIVPLGDGRTWDSQLEMSLAAKHISGNTFGEQFESIAQHMAGGLQEALKHYTTELGSGTPKLSIMMVKRLSCGEIFLARQTFHVLSVELEDGRWTHTVEPEAIMRIINGEKQVGAWWEAPDGWHPFNALGLNESDWISLMIRNGAAQNPQASQQIGGPLFIATVDSGGARWLSKPS